MDRKILEQVLDESPTPCSSRYPHPPPKKPEKEFWVAGLRSIPTFLRDPWEFYEPFVEFSSHLSLVLCNDGTEVRTMRIFDFTPEGDLNFPFLGIQHPNFVDVCELYRSHNRISVIVGYVGFSIEDLLQHSIFPTEREIAFVINQVSLEFSLIRRFLC